MENNKKPAPGTWKLYILKCSYDSYYVGCTGNLSQRIRRHSEGKVHYTKNKLPVKMLSCIVFRDRARAFKFEKYLKSGSGMAFRNRHLT